MSAPAERPNETYARYVLGVLVLVYVLNFLDRQILSILAERIKADLSLSDAELGFLYGTAFAIFYAIFGIPLGRLADVWDRRRLIAIGLGIWSVMTTASGLARNFTHLAAARTLVGIGEASSTPAAFSLLADYFPVAKRATVIAIYSSGIFIGTGLGLGIGGWIVDAWDHAWIGQAPPFGLAGWQVAFFAVGSPGLLLALWAASLREPIRGGMEGIVTVPERHPFREFGKELRAVVPPFTLLHLHLAGAGARGITVNLMAAVGITILAWGLTRLTGTPLQWIALGVGLYAAISWSQALRLRDRVAFQLIFGTPAVRYTGLGFSMFAFGIYGLTFWTAPFLIRKFGVSEGEVGLILGAFAASGGWAGVICGGFLADRWRRVTPNGRLYLAMLAAIAQIPVAVILFTTENLWTAYACTLPLNFVGALWIAPGASTITDLALPRMRATASAMYLFIMTFNGLALGPYTVGLLSVWLGSLEQALLASLTSAVLAFILIGLASRNLTHDERSLRERAWAAGKPLDS